jgi:putative FmdB family regulatory protein
MPVYEYECKSCEKVLEVQQKMADTPLTICPDCNGPITKLMSMSSFQLKGGGWYADGYASKDTSGKKEKEKEKPAPACQTGAGCKGCPAAASA